MSLIEATLAIISQNITYLESVHSWFEGNISLIQEAVDHLGISIGDLDYDGLDDLEELVHGTSISCSDTDCDNLNDAFEVKYGTDPLNDDSDGDSWLDGVEVAAGTDPKNAEDYPGMISTSTTTNGTQPTNTQPDDTLKISSGSIGMATFLGVFMVIIIQKRAKRLKV